jgi:hypothetical protein
VWKLGSKVKVSALSGKNNGFPLVLLAVSSNLSFTVLFDKSVVDPPRRSKDVGIGSSGDGWGTEIPSPIPYTKPVSSSVLKMHTLPWPWPIPRYSGYTRRPLLPTLLSLTTTDHIVGCVGERAEISSFATQK